MRADSCDICTATRGTPSYQLQFPDFCSSAVLVAWMLFFELDNYLTVEGCFYVFGDDSIRLFGR